MPQLSPLMWGFSFIMISFFLLGLILMESSYSHNKDGGRLILKKDFIYSKW